MFHIHSKLASILISPPLRVKAMFSTLVKSSSALNRTMGDKLMSTQRILSLDSLSNIPGSRKLRTRVGRGIGSGHGKNSGYGHQKSRSTPRSFEGGQTPFYKRVAKIGFHNHNERDMQILNVDKIQQFIDMGRLVPKENGLITMRNLLECGIISSCKEGVKLLANNSEELKSAIHLEVSFASRAAIKAIEDAKGTVTCVHFNRLALRALIKPLKFDILPRRARPSPKIMEYYLDKSVCGYLSPEIQARNLALFGYVTSEAESREEFHKVMHMRRHLIKAEQEIARSEALEVMAERQAQSEKDRARAQLDEFFEEKRLEQSARDRARLVESIVEKRYADRRKR